jgi:DNA invertase Pin-like site-specific DNA recombinase
MAKTNDRLIHLFCRRKMLMRRAALYLRVSTSDQRVDLQLSGLRQLAQQRGWEVVGEFIDHGFSGSKTKRPQLDQMLAEVNRGRVDTVAVWKLDRLGRSTKDLLVLLEELRVRNVEIVSTTENLDTSTPTGRAFFTMIAMWSEVEKDWLRERTVAGLAAARRRGVRLGRRPVDVDVDRALQLRSQGRSLRQVARALGVGATTVHRALQGLGGGVPMTPEQGDSDGSHEAAEIPQGTGAEASVL